MSGAAIIGACWGFIAWFVLMVWVVVAGPNQTNGLHIPRVVSALCSMTLVGAAIAVVLS